MNFIKNIFVVISLRYNYRMIGLYMFCVMSCVKGYEFSSLRFFISLDYFLLFFLFGFFYIELGFLCFLLGNLNMGSKKLI